jgi:hypothetical protein
MSYDQVETTEEIKVETVPQGKGTMQGHETREQREQLKALSAEIFGKSSRYQKLFVYDQVLTRKIKEVVPGENGAPDTEVEKEVPILAPGTTKVKQSVRRYRTVEEVIKLLQDFKAKRDEYIANMKKAQDEAKAKKDAEDQAKKIQEELGGSAL